MFHGVIQKITLAVFFETRCIFRRTIPPMDVSRVYFCQHSAFHSNPAISLSV